MEIKFKSQICTTVEQSKKLLELGLKPETADMYHTTFYRDNVGYEIIQVRNERLPLLSQELPAWSLHRLIEICPIVISNPPRFVAVSSIKTSLILLTDKISDNFNRGKTYDNVIDCIEWLINKDYFNKEYLNK